MWEKGRTLLFFDLFTLRFNRKNRDWLARIKFVSINTNLLRLNSTSVCFRALT